MSISVIRVSPVIPGHSLGLLRLTHRCVGLPLRLIASENGRTHLVVFPVQGVRLSRNGDAGVFRLPQSVLAAWDPLYFVDIVPVSEKIDWEIGLHCELYKLYYQRITSYNDATFGQTYSVIVLN